jgi:hypothetical protein
MISATENGPVALRYDNNLKLTTKSDGVDITGELQSDSLDVDGDADISGTIALGNLTIAGAQGTDGQVLTSTGSGIAWEDAAGGGVDGIVSNADATAITIDSDENILIGTDTLDAWYTSTNAGVNITNASNFIAVARSGGVPFIANRLSSDGDIMEFKKDGAAIGTIGNISTRMYIGSGDTGIYFDSIRNQVQPNNPSTGSNIDATIDLGRDIFRFKDLYLSSKVNLGDTNRNLMYRSADNDMLLEAASGLFYRQDIGNTNHSWFTGNSERMKIDSSGRVIVASGGSIHFSGNSSTGFITEDGVNLQLRSDGAMTFYTYSGGWQVRMTIADGGLISGDFNDTSDVALKENIVAIDDGMSVISQMRPVSFDWRDVVAEDKEGNEVIVPSGKGSTKGLIAQEVEAIDAELVVGEEGEKAINTSGVLAYAIKAIQEQQTMIEDLQARIETLENS